MQTFDADLPIFRSPGQARLLALLLARPDDDWLSLSEVARRIGVTPSTVQREAERLVAAGILETERVGNVRRIRADRSSRFHPELRSLLLKAAGPEPVLAEILGSVPGVTGAAIFGSWARRIVEGEGEAPRDVDLVVVGSPDPSAVYEATARAAAVLGQDVDPVIVTDDDWHAAGEGGGSAFLRAVREGPLVEFRR